MKFFKKFFFLINVHLLILLIFGSVIIFYRFNQIPKNLSFDELEFAKLALSLNNKPYTPYSPLATGHSTLYFYFILFSFKIFGINNFGLRFPSAFFGVVNGVIFYLIIRKVFFQNKKKDSFWLNLFPLFISLVFLSLRWYFNFARFAFEVTFLLFLELLSVYFLFNYFLTEKKLSLIFSFIFAGLAFHSYPPGRIFFILPLFFILKSLIFEKKTEKKTIFFISFFVYVLIITPLVIYFFYHPDLRFNQQFFLINENLNLKEKFSFLKENVIKTFFMFFYQGDANGRHNYPLKPALNPILSVFFILGFLNSFKNFKNFYNQFFLFYFFLSLLPTIFTYPWENPNMLRTFTVIPSLIFYIGRGLECLITIIFLRQNKSRLKIFLMVIIFLLFLFSSFYEIRTYFKYQAKIFENAFVVKEKLEVLIKK